MTYQYSYDRVDNIKDKVTEHGAYTYDYDNLYRLTDADNPAQADEAYTYDNVGNRLTSTDVPAEWSYSDNNELEGYEGVSFEYDDNGNMIRKTAGEQVTSIFYNLEDRLERVEDGSGSVIANYYYDPFGRRLWKEVGGARTYFVYADEGLVAEVDGSGNVIKSYGYRPGSNWTTDPLFMKQGSEYYFYQTDHLGTAQKMTAVNGAVIWSAKYSSFGEADVDASSSITNNLRFPGQYYDQETGLHYNLNRYYDTSTGRYLRVDPIGHRGGINLYSYVLNNPVNWVDPYGLINWGQVGVGTTAVIGGGITLAAGGVVIGLGIVEFATIPVDGPIGALMGIHTIGAGGVLAGAGIGLGGYGIGQIWDGLFNDNDDPCEDLLDDRPHVIPYPIPTRSPADTIDYPIPTRPRKPKDTITPYF